MKLKLFGKEIFEFKRSGADMLISNSQENLRKSKFLPDFETMRENQINETIFINESILTISENKKIKKEEIKKGLKPKEVFELKLLNDNNFKLKTGKEYINKQIEIFKDKLNLIKIAEFDMSRGVNEIASILVRLENRKKYEQFKTFFDNYAYTSIAKVNELLRNNKNLQLGKIEQFIADMPNEAIKEMKQYTLQTKKLCSKKPIFYIIADKKDFKKTDKRRDPILLAQSPFGHFWQILGAWDKEMILLEEL